MKPELENQLITSFPLVWGPQGPPDGFAHGDGWFNILWVLSEKLDPLFHDWHIQNEMNHNAQCTGCGCLRSRHRSNADGKSSRCLTVKIDPDSDAPPPGCYVACDCEEWAEEPGPRIVQVKEKLGSLRVYMTGTPEMQHQARLAENLSDKHCEDCGESAPGPREINGWWRTRCDRCYWND